MDLLGVVQPTVVFLPKVKCDARDSQNDHSNSNNNNTERCWTFVLMLFVSSPSPAQVQRFHEQADDVVVRQYRL